MKRHPSLVHERSAPASACAFHAMKLGLETTTTTLPMALVPELSRANGSIPIGTPKSCSTVQYLRYVVCAAM